MSGLNERGPQTRRTGNASRGYGEPEMSLHDGRGHARVERGEGRRRAENDDLRRRERISAAGEARRADARREYASARRYEDARAGSVRYDERRRPPVRRRKKRRGCLGRALLLVILAAVLLLAGLFAAEKLAGRLLPKIREEYYPVKYEEFIRTYADRNGLEPAHVAAVILSESSYDPEAVSSVGARGLMQLMPATAEWIAGKLGEEITEDQLFDPETNIRFGCYYLGFLMERYDDDMTCVTAAYHAGHGTVDKWLKNAEYSPDGETLEVIASDVTNTYVSRVLRRYEKYTEIYAEEPEQ